MSISKLRKVPSFSDPKEDKKAGLTQEEVKQKLNKVTRIWERESTFDTKEGALEFVRSEKTWRIRTTNKSKEGDKVVYCCNRFLQRGISSCPASLQLLYHCDSLKVFYYNFNVTILLFFIWYQQYHKLARVAMATMVRRVVACSRLRSCAVISPPVLSPYSTYGLNQ